MKNENLKDEMRKMQIKVMVSNIANWFVSTGFIMWGWNTVAPHLNAPLFNYWEIFAMRMALSHITKILHQK